MAGRAQRNGSAPPRARDVGPCRVEHRTDDQAPVVLAHLDRCFAHHAELAPYDAHLRLIGQASGEVVLVSEATGEVVARRSLERPARRRSPPNRRQPGPDPAPGDTPGASDRRLPPSIRRR